MKYFHIEETILDENVPNMYFFYVRKSYYPFYHNQ